MYIVNIHSRYLCSVMNKTDKSIHTSHHITPHHTTSNYNTLHTHTDTHIRIYTVCIDK